MTFAEYTAKSSAPAILLIEVTIGSVTKGYAKKDFKPIGSSTVYEGRLSSFFDIGFSRDPLTWGKMSFGGGSFDLNNADGEFDADASTWFQSYYGGAFRIKFGYEPLNISEYVTLWTGYIEKVSLSPEKLTISVMESRKKFDVDIDVGWTNVNALTVIKEAIIAAYPDISYNSTYFDTSAWSVASSAGIMISMDQEDKKQATAIIDDVCASIFGIFFMTNDGRYSFKIPDLDATCGTVIYGADIRNVPEIAYDTNNVCGNVWVACDVDADLDSGDDHIGVNDATREAYVYTTYKIKNTKDFSTFLVDSTAAAAFALKYLDYTCDVHGEFSIQIPMEYYTLMVGDTVKVELKREGSITYLGIIKCEITGKTYKLDGVPYIELMLRQYYDEA